MLVAQFTRLFKSHAYRLFCFIVKIDGYNYKPRISTQQCQCIVCGSDLNQEKELKMTRNRRQQLADNSQIEELKASLVKASANISRLEYILHKTIVGLDSKFVKSFVHIAKCCISLGETPFAKEAICLF